MQEKIILGIDPGTIIMGYAVIKQNGNNLSFIKMDVFNFKNIDNSLDKLEKIHFRINEIITEYKPDIMAIEAPFYSKNPQVLLKLGRAQGVAASVALSRGLKVFEYEPLRIKQSITGNGRASKEQVRAMLFRILGLSDDLIHKYLDASDALAAAVCHALKNHLNESTSINIGSTSKQEQLSTLINKGKKSKKSNSWGNFIENNPARLKK